MLRCCLISSQIRPRPCASGNQPASFRMYAILFTKFRMLPKRGGIIRTPAYLVGRINQVYQLLFVPKERSPSVSTTELPPQCIIKHPAMDEKRIRIIWFLFLQRIIKDKHSRFFINVDLKILCLRSQSGTQRQPVHMPRWYFFITCVTAAASASVYYIPVSAGAARCRCQISTPGFAGACCCHGCHLLRAELL